MKFLETRQRNTYALAGAFEYIANITRNRDGALSGICMKLVTMGEAACRMGISVDTVRRRLNRGELSGRLQRTPRGFIWLIDIPGPNRPGMTSEASAAGPASVSASNPAGGALPAGGVQALRELLDVLRHEIDANDRTHESKGRQVEMLHVLLQQTLSGPSPPGQHRTWNSGPQW